MNAKKAAIGGPNLPLLQAEKKKPGFQQRMREKKKKRRYSEKEEGKRTQKRKENPKQYDTKRKREPHQRNLHAYHLHTTTRLRRTFEHELINELYGVQNQVPDFEKTPFPCQY